MAGADLVELETELLAEIAAASDLAAIEQVRIAALGKKGRVPELMATLGKMPPDQRKAFGASVNQVKAKVTSAIVRSSFRCSFLVRSTVVLRAR